MAEYLTLRTATPASPVEGRSTSVDFRDSGSQAPAWEPTAREAPASPHAVEQAGACKTWRSQAGAWERVDQPNEVLIRDPALLSAAARAAADYPGGHNEGYADSFKQCFRAFYQYIAAGDFDAPPAFPTFADGHREILLCDAILTSHREERWVAIRHLPLAKIGESIPETSR